MYTIPRPAARPAYGVLDAASPRTHDRRRDDSTSTHASVAARSWPPPPTSQNRAYGIPYASHGSGADRAYSSPFAGGDAAHAVMPVTTCAVNPSPRGTYGHQQAALPPVVVQTHAYAAPRGAHPQLDATAANVKQEVKEEDMDWRGSPSAQDPFSAPPGRAHFSDNDHFPSGYDSSRTDDADYGPYVKAEPAYEAHPSVGFASQYTGSSSSAEDALAHEYGQGDSAVGFMPAPYIAEDGSYARPQPWPYAYYTPPPQSPDDDLYERAHYAARLPTPIQNNRSYTLENAMTPVAPAAEPPHPHPPTPTVPSHRSRPVMDYLPHPSDVAAHPPPPANVRKPAANPGPSAASAAPQAGASTPQAPSSHGQPIRRGRGRPRKHPLPTRTSPPPPVNYPYPPRDAPVQPPPGPAASGAAYDVRPQRRWMDALPEPAGTSADAQPPPQQQPQVSLDEIPFPEGAEHPGQQMFKLTSPGTAKEPVKKKPIMACLFCRERKIACGPPTLGSSEHRCNQCARRDLLCEYPKESRRGMHKRFPRAARAREQGEGAEADASASDPGAMNVQMAEPEPSAGQSAPGSQGARRRAGKERERSDSSVGPRKAGARRAGSSVMETSAP